MIGDWLARRFARRARREGNHARDARDWTTAIDRYRRYLTLMPRDFAIWVQLGHMSSEAGEYAGAETAYRTAAELSPDDADLLLCWGHLRKRTGDIEGARAFYGRSAAIDGNADARDHSARLAEPAPAQEAAVPPADAPAAEDVAVAEPPPRVHAGRVHRAEGRTLHAVAVAPDGAGATWIDYLADDRIVGTSLLNAAHREGDGYAAKALVDIDRDMMVTALRMPDGAELDNSPIMVPMPQDEHPHQPIHAWSMPLAIAKPVTMRRGGEIALFVAYARNGVLGAHVAPYIAALRTHGIDVILIALTERPLSIADAILETVCGALVRATDGGTFAGWSHALKDHPELYGASLLYLLDDGVAVTAKAERLARTIARIRASTADLVALTESRVRRWHLERSFLVVKPRLLSSTRFQRFFDDVRVRDEEAAFAAQDLRLASEAEEAGHPVEVLFPSLAAAEPTLHGWRRLIEDGFPLARLDLLSSGADVAGARTALTKAGFDPGMLDAAFAARRQSVPHEDDRRLLAHPLPPRAGAGGALAVSFYGPWNYACEEGDSARATIAALRHAGIRLNLHPVLRPFHDRRPLGPAIDIVDFQGASDIALVQLEPDDWHLLIDEQRHRIRGARKRIAYWTGAAARIDEDWWHHFPAIDRIWARDRSDAQRLVRDADAPIDIIPAVHAMPAPSASDRATRRAALGVPAASRLLVHVLDAADDGAAKIASTVTRTFAASGLARCGWWLVLQHRLAADTPDAASMRALPTPGSRNVVQHRAPPGDRRIVELADIIVVSADSLDDEVPPPGAHPADRPVIAIGADGRSIMADGRDPGASPIFAVRPADDPMARARRATAAPVDEALFAATLAEAVRSVAARQDEPGAARTFAVLGERMAESFRATLAGRGPPPVVHRIAARLLAGIPVGLANLGAGVRSLVLDRDGAPGDDAERARHGLPTRRGEWIMLAPADSVVTPLLSRILRDHVRQRPDADIFYADDMAAETEQALDQVRLKPEFDVTLLAAQDYIGAPVIVCADAFRALDGLRADMKTAAVADLLFRAHARGMSIARIPEVLLAHPGRRVRARPADYRAMLAAQPSLGAYHVVRGRTADSLALARRFTEAATPAVTIVIPTRRTALPGGAGTYIERLLEGIARVDWPMTKLTVLVGDDIVGTPAWESASWPFALERMPTPRPASERFNYAAKMNRLWRAAETEQIVFVNDDVAPLAPGWLKALQTFACDPGVGGVGARLLFEDGSLQHAGLAPHGLGAAHIWVHRWRVRGTYQDWALVHREWSMVTGAVFATRRSLMEEIGGFDERFALEFNDSDLCLRLRTLGYRIVCTPHAEMVHVEKASRGETLPRGDEVALFTGRWRSWLEADPSWHPRLRRDLIDMTPSSDEAAWYR